MKDSFDDSCLSVEEYFSLEEESLERHEYLQGARREMSGSTVNHSQLVVSTLSEIHSFLRETNHQLFHLQIKLCIEKENFIAYPDLMIVNGTAEMWNGRDDTIANAEVVIEIYTQKTERFDCGEKFKLYRRLPTLKEYILISSLQLLTEHYVKRPDGSWIFYETNKEEDLFQIERINFTCPVKDLYRNVTFD